MGRKFESVQEDVVSLGKVFNEKSQEALSYLLVLVLFDILAEIFIAADNKGMADFLQELMDNVIPSVFI